MGTGSEGDSALAPTPAVSDGTASSRNGEVLLAALGYAERGRHVMPLHAIREGRCTCGKPDCGTNEGKHPRILEWTHQATTDPEVIRGWWSKWPDANVGILTGEASGLVVLDVDPRNGGEVSLEDLELQYGPLPTTIESQTGGGGRHFFFRHPGGRLPKKIDLRPGLDVCAEGAFIVAPPSLHRSGRRYVWEVAHHPEDTDLAPVPDWLLELLTQPNRQEAAAKGPDLPVSAIPVGRRDTFMVSVGGLLRRHGLDEPAIRAALSKINETVVEQPAADPYSEAEVAQKAKSVSRYEPGPEAALDRSLPEVLIPGGHGDDQGEYTEVNNSMFVDALLSAVPEGVLYRRGVLVGTLEGEPGEMQFEEAPDPRLRILVDHDVRLVRWTKPKGGKDPVKIFIPCKTDHARLFRESVSVSPRVRRLELVTSYPVFVGEDITVIAPGWNPQYCAFYDRPLELDAITPIVNPDRIHEILCDLVVDFPFRDHASRHNFFGLLLTPLLRSAIPDANIPLHLILSSLERTGKGKLASETFGGVILGRATPVMPWVGTEEERDKRITALLKRGDTLGVIDNLNTSETLDSAVLAALLTGRRYTGRLLGRSEMVDLPNTLTLVATGNNVRCSGEIAKRTIPIVLQPTTDRPEERTDFKHKDVVTHVQQVRVHVLGALLGMVENWKAGKRLAHHQPMGGFEAWSRTVGGVLAVNGFSDWRSNAAAWVRQADPDGEDLRAFVAAWADRWPDEKKSPKDLLPLVEAMGVFPWVHKAKNDAGKLVSFAKTVLRKHENRPVDGWIIRVSGSGSMSLYYLEDHRTC